MWKYQVYNENSDVVRWAEKYLINSGGDHIFHTIIGDI